MFLQSLFDLVPPFEQLDESLNIPFSPGGSGTGGKEFGDCDLLHLERNRMRCRIVPCAKDQLPSSRCQSFSTEIKNVSPTRGDRCVISEVQLRICIAGILNEKRNVMGLMPHPECACDPLLGPPDGLPLFQGLVEALS